MSYMWLYKARQSALVRRALAVGTAGTLLRLATPTKDEDQQSSVTPEAKISFSSEVADPQRVPTNNSLEDWKNLVPLVFQRNNASVARMEGLFNNNKPTSNLGLATAAAPEEVSYDFVVLGNGNAGGSAVAHLQKLCPQATIAVVDPLRGKQTSTSRNSTTTPDYYNVRATALHPRSKTVHLEQDDGKPSPSIRYRHGLLLATGCHGAPPPSYLVEPAARPHVKELRSSTPSMHAPLAGVAAGAKTADASPMGIRHHVLDAAARGQRVALLGSGWDAVELAVAASRNSARATKPPTLIFGNPGPVSDVLPNYLSAALKKRLESLPMRSGRVHLWDRSLVRYVNVASVPSKLKNKKSEEGDATLRVYTAKVYDLMESHMTDANVLVVAPDVDGSRGNAAQPTNNFPNHIQSLLFPQSNQQLAQEEILEDGHHTWYRTWAQLATDPRSPSTASMAASTSTQLWDGGDDVLIHGINFGGDLQGPLLSCYQDDGRIAVNAELNACTAVYAAGSVAKVANALSGQACVAGAGTLDATLAGRVAAANMARHYPSSTRRDTISGDVYIRDPLPVWRSDILSYGVGSSGDGDGEPPSSLASVGIMALCVGHCDVQRYATHGVWWTHRATLGRLMRSLMGDGGKQARVSLLDEEEDDDPFKADETEDEKARKAKLANRRARRIMTLRRHQAAEDLGARSGGGMSVVTTGTKPVYGMGAVYYLDRTGRLQGIMLWGVPYAFKDNDSQRTMLHARLIQEIKHILRQSASLSEDGEGLLHPTEEDLTIISRRLMSLAFTSPSETDDPLVQPVEDEAGPLVHTDLFEMNKPLHRYTDVKPVKVRHVSVLKRGNNDHGHGALGEDLFARCQEETDEESGLEDEEPSPLANADPSSAALRSTVYLRNRRRERVWDANESVARPAQEEPLWIRRGDEKKSLNASETRQSTLHSLLLGKRSVPDKVSKSWSPLTTSSRGGREGSD